MRTFICAFVMVVLANSSTACGSLNLNNRGQQNLAQDLGLGFRPYSNQGLPVKLCAINHSGANGGAYAQLRREPNKVADFVVFYPTLGALRADRNSFTNATVHLGVARTNVTVENDVKRNVMRVAGQRVAPRQTRLSYRSTGGWGNITVTVYSYQRSDGSVLAQGALRANPSRGSRAAAEGVRHLIGTTKVLALGAGDERRLASMLYRTVNSIPLLSAPDTLSTVGE